MLEDLLVAELAANRAHKMLNKQDQEERLE